MDSVATGHDFFAVDDTVAVIPSANVVNFDLLSSFDYLRDAANFGP